MYLEDYSLALFFSFALATVYLCIILLSYCHRYLFIYLFIEPASPYDFNVNWIWH